MVKEIQINLIMKEIVPATLGILLYLSPVIVIAFIVWQTNRKEKYS